MQQCGDGNSVVMQQCGDGGSSPLHTRVASFVINQSVSLIVPAHSIKHCSSPRCIDAMYIRERIQYTFMVVLPAAYCSLLCGRRSYDHWVLQRR